jgi:large subunit ribosomal protein L25
MSSDEITLTVEERTITGKAVKHLRKDGMVPAVIHNHGQASTHVVVPYVDLLKVYRQAGKHHPISLKVGGKSHLTIIKDADFEPKKHMLRHVVFNAIRQDQAVEAEVPVRIEGDVPAERASLMVITQLETVMISALPKDLPDELVVAADGLAEVGDRLHVSDIKLPAGVTLVNDPEQVIAHVEMPKDQVAEADAAAAELAADKEASEGEAEEGEAAPAADSESDDSEAAADENAEA